MKSIVTHHSLGEITVSQTWRARRISLSVKPPGRVTLSLPYSVPLSEAMKFVDSKQEWVRKALAKYEVMEADKVISMPYATRRHSLSLIPCETAKITVRLKDGRVIVSYPIEMNYADPQVQSAIKKGIEEAWRAEAKELLPPRLAELARQLGLRYRSVVVRNTVSKWGSCSARDDISLSVHLMRLPDHLIDYILIHELCHTVHKNHSPKFYALLDRCVGGRHLQLRKELKQYHTRW